MDKILFNIIITLMINISVIQAQSYWEQTKKVSNTGDFDGFGSAISIDGNYAFIGRPRSNAHGENSGLVHVYKNNEGNWEETTQLISDEITAGDFFGGSVYASGNFVFISAGGADGIEENSGAVYVFEKQGNNWQQIAKLIAADGKASDQFGVSIAVAGNDIAVGAYNVIHNSLVSGSVYVFTKPESGWSDMMHTAKLSPSTENDQWVVGVGYVVSISDNLVVAGASDSYTCTAFLFEKPETGWTDMNETLELAPNTGIEADDEFGQSVGIYNGHIVVVADLVGKAYIFNKQDTDWQQIAELSTDHTSDWTNSTASFSDDRISIASGNDIYIYEKPETGWQDMKENSMISGNEEGITKEIHAISLSNDDLLIGCPYYSMSNPQPSDIFWFKRKVLNNVPSFIKGTDVEILEDAGAQLINEWATGISDGNDETQMLTFNVSNDNNSLFSVQPTIDSNGNLNFTPATNEYGLATVTISLADDGGTENGGVDTSEEQNFTITVTSVNDSPQLEALTGLSATEDIEYNYQVIVSDPDDENNGTDLTWSLNNAPEGMVISSTGFINWTPIEGILNSGEVRIIVSDGGEDNAIPAQEVFNISVTVVNDSPELEAVTELSATEDIEYNYQVIVSDSDDENNGTDLSWSLNNAPEGMLISNTGVINWTPTEGILNSGNVTVIVSDGGEDQSATSQESFNITVTPVNDSPEILSNAPVSATEDIEYIYQVQVFDPDDENNGSDLSWDLGSAPDGMTISNTGVVNWIPTEGVLTSGEVILTVTDGGEDSAISGVEVFTITVTPVNDEPIIEDLEELIVCEESSQELDLIAITTDPDNSIHDISFSAVLTPEIPGLTIEIDNASGILTITNNTQNVNALANIELYAEDILGAVGTQNITLRLLHQEVEIFQDGNILTASEGESYQWFRNGVVIPEADGGYLRTITASEVGSYSVAVGYAGTCAGISDEVYIDNLTNLKLKDISSQISVYPNPVADFIHLQMEYHPEEISKIQLYDIHGMLVLDQNDTEGKINVSEFPKGIYILQIVIGDKDIARKRVVKQ